MFYISGKIAKLLSASNKIVGVPRASHAWKEYTEYVNEIVIDGLSNAICASTKYLTDQIDPAVILHNETPPLLEVKLELGTAVWAFPNPGTHFDALYEVQAASLTSTKGAALEY